MRKLTKTAAIVASMAVMAMGATIMTSAATEGWVQRIEEKKRRGASVCHFHSKQYQLQVVIE